MMPGRAHEIVFLAALGLLLLAGSPNARANAKCPARPNDPTAAKRLASRSWQQAVGHYKAGRYLPAIRAWQCANRLAPHPLALYNIGRAADRAGKLALALQSYEAFLRAQSSDASKRSEATAAISRLRARVRAQVRPRRVIARRRSAVVTRPTEPSTRSRRRQALGVAGWTSVGAGVVLAALSGVLGGLAEKEKRAVRDADPGTPYTPTITDHVDTYDRYRLGAWIAAGVGAAALVTGTVLLIVGRRGRRTERVTVTPATWPGGAGLSIGGRF